VDGVKTRLRRARVTANRAAAGGGGLSGGIGDVVTAASAAALEGMVETHPVANLVGGGVAEVVVGERATGDGAVEDGATVAVERSRARGDGLREVAVAEVTTHLVQVVDIQGTVGALAEGPLHGHLVALGVISPVGIDGTGDTLEVELEAVRSIGGVENVELVVEHGILCEVLALSQATS